MNEITTDITPHSIAIDQPCLYRLRVQGRLSDGIRRQFDDMTVMTSSDRAITTTTFLAPVADQAALHGLIARVRDVGLPLLLVELVSPISSGDIDHEQRE